MARSQLTIRSLLGFTTIVAVWLGLFSVFPSVAFNLSGVFLLAFLAIQFMDIQFMFWAPLTVILMAYVETYLPAMGGMPNEVFYGMLGILFCNSIAIRSIARTRKAFANANRMAGVLSTGIANSSKAGFTLGCSLAILMTVFLVIHFQFLDLPAVLLGYPIAGAVLGAIIGFPLSFIGAIIARDELRERNRVRGRNRKFNV